MMIQNKKIFISYSDNDQSKAIKLCEVLESSGFKCWLSYRDSIPGKNFLENIFEAMSNSALMIVLYSEKALSEKRLGQEAEIAFDTEIPIIPLRIENVEVKGVLKFVFGTLQWIEAFEKPFEEYFPQIISAVKRLLDVEERGQKDIQPIAHEPLSVFVSSQPEGPEGSSGKPKEEKKEPKIVAPSELGKDEPSSPLLPQEQEEKKEYKMYSHEYPKKKEIFISYSNLDEEIVLKLREKLESCGFNCWIHKKAIQVGENFAEEIVDAINQCIVMIVICSRNSIDSNHVKREVNLAVDRKLSILPLQIEDVELSKTLHYLLSLHQILDVYEEPLENYYPRIISKIKRLLSKENS